MYCLVVSHVCRRVPHPFSLRNGPGTPLFPSESPSFPLRQRQPDTLSPALSSCLPSRRRVFLHISPRNALLFPQGLIPFIFSSETPSFFPQEVPLSLLAPPFHSFSPQKRPPFPSGGPPLSVGPSPLSPGDRRQGTQDVGDKRYEIGGRRQETDQTGVRRQ